jgi:hypothetical protein
MRSQKQIDASRQNGRNSSGAATPEGKARIVAANLKSGIYAETEILPWEETGDLEELKAEYFDHHQPDSPEARLLVDELITCEWTLRRLRLADSALWELSAKEVPNPDPRFAPAQAFSHSDRTFARLQHRLNSTRAAYHRALKALQKLEAAAHTAVTPAEESSLPILGSLRQQPSPAPDPEPAPPDPRPLTPDPAPISQLQQHTPDATDIPSRIPEEHRPC